MSDQTAFVVYPIGYVRRMEGGLQLEILEPYRPALRQLERFSHVMVFWWADRHDSDTSRHIMQTRPPTQRTRWSACLPPGPSTAPTQSA